jgi:hypothetical protein
LIVTFLRRLLGSDDDRGKPSRGAEAGAPRTRWPRGRDDQLPDDEVERERALLRAEAERLDNELIQRQMRYADRSWTPPAEGGERRAEDEDASDR